jgi:hypothetical protein
MMMMDVAVVHSTDAYHEPKELLIDVNIEFVEIMKNIEIDKIPFWKEKQNNLYSGSLNLFKIIDEYLRKTKLIIFNFNMNK